MEAAIGRLQNGSWHGLGRRQLEGEPGPAIVQAIPRPASPQEDGQRRGFNFHALEVPSPKSLGAVADNESPAPAPQRFRAQVRPGTVYQRSELRLVDSLAIVLQE